MPDLPRTPRTTHRRLANRGSHDRDLIHAILDEGLVCHVGFALDGQPYVLPTTYARMGDRLVMHGSLSNRMLRALASGAPACVTVSLLDGLVLARSAFHHSMNYRSVVVLGSGRAVEGREAKRAALEAIVEHVVPGRLRQARPPADREVDGTLVVEVPIVEASAKFRSGPPMDDAGDLALDCWAGVIPLHLCAGEPVPDAHVPAGKAAPMVGRGRSRAVGPTGTP
jgi:nitroimidazol reductase NimA-like FMN-containing flavoprotein (pyridoxamine 5'-phosphate oxidase superfamily)